MAVGGAFASWSKHLSGRIEAALQPSAVASEGVPAVD
jgi:hypothetical protein